MSDKEYLKKYLSADKLEEGLKRLASGECVQYILGNVNFYGNIIKVNKNVLIPRFETEFLVDKTIKYASEYFDGRVNILDIGTGSGNIAISLKKKLECLVTGVDISPLAISLAKENAVCNNVDALFIVSDLFSNVEGKYDIIISNPPYIAYDEEIEDIVRNNEPSLALFADDNGLKFYEDILRESKRYINEKSIIAFEIGRTQGNSVKDIAYKYYPNAKVSVEKDYPGEDRFVFIFNEVR